MQFGVFRLHIISILNLQENGIHVSSVAANRTI